MELFFSHPVTIINQFPRPKLFIHAMLAKAENKERKAGIGPNPIINTPQPSSRQATSLTAKHSSARQTAQQNKQFFQARTVEGFTPTFSKSCS
jgi:hypothetical protein